jgi:hypothetical protein
MGERGTLAGTEAEVGDSGLLGLESLTGDARLPPVAEPVGGRRVLDVREVGVRVAAQWQVLNVSDFSALRPSLSVARTSSLCFPRFSFFVLTFSENESFCFSAIR